MAETPESDKKGKKEPKPGKKPSPKRGAIPTPKAEIEKATPYIPETDQAGDKSATEDVSPENMDPEEDSEEELDDVTNPSHARRKTMPVQSPKRGAFPSPRSALAAAIPHVAAVGAPPNFIKVPARISMWGNDVHGDCVTAEEAFAKASNNPEIFIPDGQVISWATRHGVLEGANLVQVLRSMQTDGFRKGKCTYDDGPHFSVNWTNSTTLQSAISQGPVKIGVAANQLETAWHSTNGTSGWFAVGFHTDTNIDHCVSLCGYGTISWLAQQLNVHVPAGVDGTKTAYALFTWNSVGIIDEPSMLAITQEAWLRRPTTVRKGPRARRARLRAKRRAIARRLVAALVQRRVNAIMRNWGRRIVRRRVAALMARHRAAGHRPRVLAQIRRRIRLRVARRIRAHFRRHVKRHLRQALHHL
jgi:hypothetical protein